MGQIELGNLGAYAIKVLIKLLGLEFTADEVFGQVLVSAETMLVLLLAAGVLVSFLAWTETRFIQCVQGFVCGMLLSRLLGTFVVMAGLLGKDELRFLDILLGCLGALIGLLTKHAGAVVNTVLLFTYLGAIVTSDSVDMLMRMLIGFFVGLGVAVVSTVILDVSRFTQYLAFSAAEVAVVVWYKTEDLLLSLIIYLLFLGFGLMFYVITHKIQWFTAEEKEYIKERLVASNKLEVQKEKQYKKARIVKNKKKLVIYGSGMCLLAFLCWYLPKNDTVMYNYCMVKAKLVRDSEKEQTYEKAKSYKDWFGAYRELARLHSVNGNMSGLQEELEETKEKFGENDKKVLGLVDELTVDAPTFNVDGGNYKTGQVVELKENENGDSIVYTLEKTGTADDKSEKLEYSEPITLDEDGTYKITARSVTRKGYTSETVSHTYTLDLNFPGMVVASTPGGEYETGFNVELTSDEGYILYTLDGKDPTNTSKLYKNPINIDFGVTTIKSVSVNRLGKASDVSTEVYKVSYGDSASTSEFSSGYSGYYYDYVMVKDELEMPVISVRNKKTGKEMYRISGKYPNEYGNVLYYLDSSGYIGELNLADMTVSVNKDFETERFVVEHGGIYYVERNNGQLKFYDFETESTTLVNDEYAKLLMRCDGVMYYITQDGLYRVEQKLGNSILLMKCGPAVKAEQIEKEQSGKKTFGSLAGTVGNSIEDTDEPKKSTSEQLKEQIVQKEKEYNITDAYTADNENVYYIEDGSLYLLNMKSLTYKKVINSDIESSDNVASGYTINPDGSVLFFDTDGILKTWRNNGVVAYVDSVTGEEVRTYNNSEMPWTAEQRDVRVLKYSELRGLKVDAENRRKVGLTGLNSVGQNEDGTYTLENGLRATTNADGSLSLSDGSTVYVNGTIELNDGTMIAPDGTKVFKDGTVVMSSGQVNYKNGDVVMSDNSIRYSNGVTVDTDGTIKYPNGMKVNIGNMVFYPDGSTLDVNGKRTAADGTVTYEGPISSDLNNGKFDKIERTCLGLSGSNETLAVKMQERVESYDIDSLSDALLGSETTDKLGWNILKEDGTTEELISDSEYLIFTDTGYYCDNGMYNGYKH